MAPVNNSDVEQLRASLSATALIVTPDSELYDTSIKRWASSAERPAAIVVFPTSAEDVAKAILFSTAQNLELAVSGGGHATSGSSSTDGGLCIDLSKMRSVTVDPTTKTVTAQGGALWSDVDIEAEKHGLAAVGGTVNHTGIGGLTLGGGYGYLTGKVGLVIDNLLSAEIVLADGRIVTASTSGNEDLFWAIRGAGVSFGVATKFVYQAYEQKNLVWGGMLVFPKTQLDAVIAFANTIFKTSQGEATVLMGFGAPPPAFQPVIMAVCFYNGEEDAAKKFFEPLLSLNPLANMTSAMPYSRANTMLNEGMGAGFRRNMKGSAFLAPLDTAFAASIFQDFEEFIQRLPDAGLTVVLFEFVPFHKLLSVPQTSTAFANRGAYGNLMFGPGWTDPKNDNECREWTRVMAKKARAEFEKRKAEEGTDQVTGAGVGEYGNYDGLGESARTIFGPNALRLKDLKGRYDPGNVFRKGTQLLS